MQEIQGFVEHIIYRADQDGYKVMSFSTTEEDIVVVGNFPGVEEAQTLLVKGEYVNHDTYGRQFKAVSFRVSMPTDTEGIEKYLSSGAIKGIGKATAKRIVSKFKEDTLRIIEEEPHRLAEIRGISAKKAADIAAQASEKRELRDVIIYLDGYGIGPALALRIYGEYGSKVYKILEENPYRLAEDIDGVGFKRADSIALKMNMAIDSDYRINAAIIYGLSRGLLEGHTFIVADNLRRVVSTLLDSEIESIDTHLMNLFVDKKIVLEEDRVYLSSFHYMEVRCARSLVALDDTYTIDEEKLESVISRVEDKNDIVLDTLQRDAVKTAISHGVCILTGGPGTGKTTTIRTMIEFFESEGLEISLAAPTGRAAKRMTEATKRSARTIHRLLEVKGASADDGSSALFERNKDNPLECDVVIIDEMSMVDTTLFFHLLSAISSGTRLIMVGDTNQLPSVGAGNVLRDVIASNAFAVVTLDKVFRQSDTSDIIGNAIKINNYEPIDLDKKSDDFFFIKRSDAESVQSLIERLIVDKLSNYLGENPLDIQVLTPSKKGLLGCVALNNSLQDKLNPVSSDKAEINFGDKIFRVGDKVMQIKNNYQLEWKVYSTSNIEIDSGDGVFNGDMGIVTMIDKVTSTLRVLYDDERSVDYSFAGLGELELAYAITVHKSQGSEYPAVIIPLLRIPEQLMTRNILYTAITRAKKCVVIIGSKEVFTEMARSTIIAQRNSSLDMRISELV